MVLKTYSISADITAGELDAAKLHTEISNSGYVTSFEGLAINANNIDVHGSVITNESGLDDLVANHIIDSPYEIHSDVVPSLKQKDVIAINYKTELQDGIAYTPEFIVHAEAGELMGLLDKTNYYRNWVDDTNKGTLVLVAKEVYIMNSDPSIPNSAVAPLSRIKTWKYARENGELDEINKKSRPKKYNTRRKRHKLGINKRNNIIEQLIDNVGTAGVISGTFTDELDAHSKLTALLIADSAEFIGYKESGLNGVGTIYDVVLNDTTTTWLDSVIPDNATTQAVIPWMIGLDLRDYIISKLKGDIK